MHLHDIFLPAEYPRDWILKEHRFWTEQYLLQVLLTFSYGFQVLWAGSYMHLNHPEKLEKALIPTADPLAGQAASGLHEHRAVET